MKIMDWEKSTRWLSPRVSVALSRTPNNRFQPTRQPQFHSSSVMVAPIILGVGGPGIALPSLDRADQAPRMPVRVHKIDDDVLFDCDLSAQRVALGIAKKST